MALALFALVLAAYMLTYSRAFDIRADEGTMFAVAESMVKFGRFNIDQANHLQYIHAAAIGRDGARYAKYGLGQSIAAAPLYGLGLALPVVGLIDVVLLLNPLAGAAAAMLVMLAAIELGASRRRALWVALLYAFGTPAWVYAKNFYSEPLAALGFGLASWGLVMLLVRQRTAGAFLAGAGIGLAVLVKSSALVAAPVLLGVAWVYGRARRWHWTLAAATPVLMAVLIVGVYNWLRFGHPANSGYGTEGFSVYPWIGAFGMLFAPGRSLFIYAPIMLAAVPGLWLIRRPTGLRTWLIGTALAMLLLHGAWWSWWGAWSWGPRFLVPVLPLLALGLWGVLNWATHQGRGVKMCLGLLALASFMLQLPGVLVYRTVFFFEVINLHGPDTIPDEVSLYDVRYFMPLTNLREALHGNLDLAWKPGLDAPIDSTGLLLVSLGLLIALVGFGLVWRGIRRRAVALVCPCLVFGLACLSLTHYYSQDRNPFRTLMATLDQRVPPNAIILISDESPETSRQLWNVNRSMRRMVGVPSDTGQMQLHTLPVVQRAVQSGDQVWTLQVGDNRSEVLLTALRDLGLCANAVWLDTDVRLVQWERCVAIDRNPHFWYHSIMAE